MTIDKNIPNYLTMLRILAIPLIILSFYFTESKIARIVGAAIFSVASITDFLDGYLARKYKITSNFGRMFDQIADKILVGCILFMLVKFDRVSEIPAILILIREFIVSGFREFLAQLQVSVPVSRLAKVKTVIQMIALAMLVLGSYGSGIQYFDTIAVILLWIAVVMTLITGYSYLKVASKYI